MGYQKTVIIVAGANYATAFKVAWRRGAVQVIMTSVVD